MKTNNNCIDGAESDVSVNIEDKPKHYPMTCRLTLVLIHFCNVCQYYKVIRVFVCLCVCLKLNNSGTAGPIWPNFFLLAPYWPGDGFRQKRFRIRGLVFPKIRKNRFPAKIIIKYFSKIFEFSCGKSPK